VEYEELLELLKEYCMSGELIPEERFINTFDIMQDQGLIYVEAPFQKKYLLNQHRIIHIIVGDISTYITAMSVEVYDKNQFRSNSILIRKINNKDIQILAITSMAKGNNVVYGNLENLFENRR
jgi:hypothetical protein